MEGATVSLSTVLSALSYALDLTEGHPAGHSTRSCLIGMRVAEELRLPVDDRSNLFYALLMKDAGCSSNAARVYQLFGGDDQTAKHAVWLRDWRRWHDKVAYALQYTEPAGTPLERLRRFVGLALAGPMAERELFQVRCDQGADIARELGMAEPSAEAIRAMDEHWDGGGFPEGLARDRIPLLAQIIGLAQVAEIFWGVGGPDAALDVVRRRKGRWFDPELVRVLEAVGEGDALWGALEADDLAPALVAAEPREQALPADESRLDRIAHAFALVVDAKSSFTYQHSDRVAAAAEAIGAEMGLPEAERVRLRRAGLLHDIGKLAVPNRILDKPDRLTDEEWTVVKTHPYHTYEILARVPVFQEFAWDASLHHERLDGRGYHRGLGADALNTHARILCTADVFDALHAKRPYRDAMPMDQVLGILRDSAGTHLCPVTVEAICAAHSPSSGGGDV